jgi:Protein of unknown function (DUF998)
MTSDTSIRPGTEHRTRSARPWLRAGAVAGPLFLAVSFAQVPFRDGFDLTRHAFSFLLLGPGGRVQQLNFLLTGALFVAAAVGLRRSCGRPAGALATGLGLGLVVGGLFPPDPYRGYPRGSVEGPMSTSGMLHAVGFTAGMLCWAALLVVLARWFGRHGRRGAATVAACTVLALAAVPATTGQPFDVTLLYVATSAAYLITTALLVLVARTAAEQEEVR